MRQLFMLYAVLAIAVPEASGRSVVVEATGLRSAFLLRATGGDRAAPVANAAERQARLRTHFAKVLKALVESTPASLEIALDRLEASRSESWTSAERADWHAKLAAARLTQILRLQRYAQRGLFPINEHVATRAVPVFVDNYDTACAVGHLMRESGWEKVVAQIQRMNNLVYVTDRGAAPVAKWALTSGFTLEEAATIQPAYEPPPFNASMAQLLSGGSVVTDDLKYDNFRFGRSDVPEGEYVAYLNSVSDPVYQSQIGVAAGDYIYVAPNGAPQMETLHDEWAFIGSRTAGGMASANRNSNRYIFMSYDVSVLNPASQIVGFALQQIVWFDGSSYSPPYGGYVIESVVTRPSSNSPFYDYLFNSLQKLTIRGGVGQPWSPTSNATLPPLQKLTVYTHVELTGEAALGSFLHSFQVVPEPTSLTVAMTLGIAVFRPRSRGLSRGGKWHCPA